jgi:hypothetical protein
VIDREEFAARLFAAMWTHAEETANAHGSYIPPKTDELAALAFAAAQTFASVSCRHFGHTYGGEGVMHAHECSRCGGDISSLVKADEAAWKLTQSNLRTQGYFQPKRVYIGDCD